MTTELMTKAKAESAEKVVIARRVEVVTLPKSVFEQISGGHGLAKKQVHGLVAGLVEALTTHLVKGGGTPNSGLGILGKEPSSSHQSRPGNE